MLILLLLAFFTPPAAAQATCALDVPCMVGARSYHAKVPDGWDGERSLPVLLHFHGWARQGPLIMRHRRIARAANDRGVLLIAPNGIDRTWHFWDAASRDVPFARNVLADAAKRWPIDPARIYVSGYSFGGAMAWRFACAAGNEVAALLAIAGTFGNQNETCKHPLTVRHVHGTTDTVMRYPFGTGGDITEPVRLWRRANGCTGEPIVTRYRAVLRRTLVRYEWNTCASGESVTLDTHNSGHFIPRQWLDVQLAELLGQPVRRAVKEPNIGRHADGLWP